MPRHIQLDAAGLRRLIRGAVLATDDRAIFEITGPGAVTCLQGLWTNDIVAPGEDTITYGALLTPKGMIVTDGWLLRERDRLLLVSPAGARESIATIFSRALPPRLAQARDVGEEQRAAWLLGVDSAARWRASGLWPLPGEAGRIVRRDLDGAPVALANAPHPAPFVALLVGPAPALDAARSRLAQAIVHAGGPDDVEAARILAGWPALGAEIDERTLPQEVRFDELGGVSYTKGCYTGQETVARLHFRGHANRELRGLVWQHPAPLDGATVMQGHREVGRVRSVLTLPARRLGLAVIRRDVEPGAIVSAGGREAEVSAIPFDHSGVGG